MKPWKGLTAAAVLGMLLATPAAADVSTQIYYNDELLATQQPVENINGRVLLAFRDLFEHLDGEVSWNEEFRMASVTYGKNTINLFPDTGAVQVNGTPQALAVGPQIINDRVYLPLRFVAQALGGTVDYSKGENDTGIIKIHTIDSVQNFAQKIGSVTRILRTTSAPDSTIVPEDKANAAYQQWKNHKSMYFMDDHGKLVEVQSYDQKIQVNLIDLDNAKVESKIYDTGILYPALTSIHKEGTTYTIGINETSSTRYAGVGTPTNGNREIMLKTDQGNLDLYDGEKSTTVFQFDASAEEGSIRTQTTTGKVLDLAQRLNDADKTSYAVTADGTYAYLMDGQLLIVDAKDEIKEDVMLTGSAGDGYLYAIGNQFVAVLTEKNSRHPEVYAAIYNSDGTVVHAFQNISNLSKITDEETFYDYKNLTITDIALWKNNVYLLLKTDMDYYIVTYDTRTNTSQKERLSIKEKNYQKFIYTMDDLKLFSSEEDYFYLRDIN